MEKSKRLVVFVILAMSQYFIQELIAQTPVPYLKKNGKYIYVNPANMKPVLTAEYDLAGPFDGDYASVSNNKLWGIIDRSGKTILPIAHPPIEMKYGFAQALNKDFSVIIISMETGESILPNLPGSPGMLVDGMSKIKSGDHFWFYNTRNKKTIDLGNRYNDVGSFSEGLATFSPKPAKPGDGVLWGYIDKTGKEVISPKYNWATNFHDGLAAVYRKDVGKWGYIDKTGKEVIPLNLDGAEDFSEGLAWVRKNGRPGLIDKQGKFLELYDYTSKYKFSDGLAGVTLGNKCGYIDRLGREVIPPTLDCAMPNEFSEGMAVIQQRAEDGYVYGYIDKTGRIIIPVKYDIATRFSNGIARVKRDGKLVYINKAGQEFLEH